MLRITVQVDSPGLRLRLEGRLAGPWVAEVEHCWQTVRQDKRGRPLTVDLRDVDFVDHAGEQLLASIYEDGARLIATGLMIKGLVSRITGER
jgi:anti-anti-sigma regulatory factor